MDGVELHTQWKDFNELGLKLEVTASCPIDTCLHEEQRLGLLDQAEKLVTNDLCTLYRKMFWLMIKIGTGKETEPKFSNLFNVIHHVVASEYANGNLHDLTDTLILASAQRRALQEVLSTHFSEEDFHLHVLYSKLLATEMALHSKLCESHFNSLWWNDREANLRFWHSAWIDRAFFDEIDGVLSTSALSITRAEVAEKYQNPFRNRGVLWIGFEGLDASGKDTQLAILEQYLSDTLGFTCTRQPVPTNGPLGKLARQVLRREVEVSKKALQKLFVADRLALLESADKSLMQMLLTNRHSPSGIAYGSHSFRELVQSVIDNLDAGGPDLTIFINVPPEVCMERIRKRGETELLEQMDTLSMARDNYIRLGAILPQFRRVNGVDVLGRVKTVRQVFEEILYQIVEHVPDTKLSKADKQRLLENFEYWFEQHLKLFEV